MPELVNIPIGSNCYKSRSGNVSIQQLINLYAEPNPQGSSTPFTLYPTPGLKRWIQLGSGPIRGMHQMGGYLWVVSGETLYRVLNNGTYVEVTGAIAGNDPVRMIDNGTHLGISTPVSFYYANIDGVFSNTTVPNICGLTYQDGYGILAEGDSEKFWITGLDDMTTIDGLDFSSADVFADNLKGCISDHRELWLFGENTVEIWSDTGNADFPFGRNQSGFIEHGCLSGNTVAKINNHVFWLGDDYAVYTNNGYQPQEISTPAIEKIIRESSFAKDAYAFTYRDEGHAFYVLSLKETTLCYDMITGLWHERLSSGSRWIVQTIENAFETNYCGTRNNGWVYELDLNTYLEDTEYISRQCVFPAITSYSQGARMVSVHEMIINIETGTANLSGNGSTPTAQLQWSDDYGSTWSNQISRSIGLRGERNAIVNFSRLGAFVDRTFKLTIFEPIKLAILGAYARLESRG